MLRSLFLALMLSLLTLPSAMGAEEIKYRLVLQLSEDSIDRLMVALNAARDVQREFGPAHVEVQIVTFAGGIQTLKYYAPIPVPERIREAKHEGVRVVVCEQAMRKAKLKPSDMLQDVAFVPSGVAEILEKASLGWVVIRP